jgi:hypothetical protein
LSLLRHQAARPAVGEETDLLMVRLQPTEAAVTIREAAAINVVLDFIFGTDFDPDRLRLALVGLAEAAERKLGDGWTGARVEELTRR